jgi:hypothetical protein
MRPRKPSLVGQRFGKLLVVELVPGPGREWYFCTCDCGEKVKKPGAGLRAGNMTTCWRKQHASERRLGYGDSARNFTLKQYRRNAAKRGLVFAITDEEAIALFAQDCHYCGAKPSNIARLKLGYGEFVYSGIDRKDNTIGYIAGNVVPCCLTCNERKRTASYEEFVAWIKRASFNLQLGDVDRLD